MVAIRSPAHQKPGKSTRTAEIVFTEVKIGLILRHQARILLRPYRHIGVMARRR
jgi:hypothetical protein